MARRPQSVTIAQVIIYIISVLAALGALAMIGLGVTGMLSGATMAGSVADSDSAGLAGAFGGLIGLFAGPEGRTALLRLDTGAVVRAAPGDVIDGAVVTAIAEDALRLWQDGRERVLTMPA